MPSSPSARRRSTRRNTGGSIASDAVTSHVPQSAYVNSTNRFNVNGGSSVAAASRQRRSSGGSLASDRVIDLYQSHTNISSPSCGGGSSPKSTRTRRPASGKTQKQQLAGSPAYFRMMSHLETLGGGNIAPKNANANANAPKNANANASKNAKANAPKNANANAPKNANIREPGAKPLLPPTNTGNKKIGSKNVKNANVQKKKMSGGSSDPALDSLFVTNRISSSNHLPSNVPEANRSLDSLTNRAVINSQPSTLQPRNYDTWQFPKPESHPFSLHDTPLTGPAQANFSSLPSAEPYKYHL